MCTQRIQRVMIILGKGVLAPWGRGTSQSIVQDLHVVHVENQ